MESYLDSNTCLIVVFELSHRDSVIMTQSNKLSRLGYLFEKFALLPLSSFGFQLDHTGKFTSNDRGFVSAVHNLIF